VDRLTCEKENVIEPAPPPIIIGLYNSAEAPEVYLICLGCVVGQP